MKPTHTRTLLDAVGHSDLATIDWLAYLAESPGTPQRIAELAGKLVPIVRASSITTDRDLAAVLLTMVGMLEDQMTALLRDLGRRD